MSEAFGALAGASAKLPRGNDLLANVRFGSLADMVWSAPLLVDSFRRRF